jgi:single-stranded-DNA-specific exonuclease
VGVMFYVLMALRAHLRDVEGWPAAQIPRLDDLLPIVALGTVADVVRLDANNRRLVAQGLARIRRGAAPAGLQALFQVARIDIRQANAIHLGFAIGPRINAAGRLSDMSVGIRCLLEDAHQPGLDLARQLDELNRERRSIEADAREQAATQAAALLAEQPTDQDRIGLVLHAATWHQGVIGLVAGRLKESLYRPVIVFTDDGDSGRIKGSCRSIPGIHIRDVLERVDTRHPGMILAFGGHAMAAGLTLQADRLEHFREAFEEALRDFADPTDLQNITDTDGPLQPDEMQLDTARILSGEVWGQGFPPPLFRNTFRILNQRQLQERHLKLVLAPGDAATMRLDAIWFNGPPDIGSQAELLYRLAVNEWDGRSTLQLEIVGRV